MLIGCQPPCLPAEGQGLLSDAEQETHSQQQLQHQLSPLGQASVPRGKELEHLQSHPEAENSVV